ncbi:MAG: aryl-sulfate sulfotransferase [Pseudomonadota bacterium]
MRLALLLLAACTPVGDGPSDDTAVDDTAVEEVPLEIADLTLEPSAAITLVATLRWTTPLEATGAVEFGPAEGDFELVVDHGDVGTEHEVVVVGMHEATAYQLRAVSTTAGGQEVRSEPVTFTTGTVPDPWRPLVLDAYDPARTQPGWTLFNVATGYSTRTLVVMVDLDGEPVWYFDDGDGGRSDVVPELVDGRRVLIGPGVPSGSHPIAVDLAGEVLWTGPQQDLGFTDGGFHHVFHELQDGTHMLVEYTSDSLGYMGDTIQVFDDDLNIVWDWCTFDHLADHPAWVHTNAVFLDEPGGLLYANSYQMGQTYKIHRESGDVLWTFGEGGDFAPDPWEVEPFPYHAHAFQILPDGHVLMYDNGSSERGWSRVVEYALDEDSMTSEIVWQYPGRLAWDPWWAAAWGDVERLENGNTLINASAGTNTPAETVSRLFEVTPEGDTVWQAWLYQGLGLELGAYAVSRVPAIARPIAGEGR